MSITSFSFVLFCFLLIALYYAVPGKLQWTVLLLASAVFYLVTSPGGAVYVLVTALSVYLAVRRLDALSRERKATLKERHGSFSREEKARYKEQMQKRRRRVLIAALLLNFGLLCYFKYFHFFLAQMSALSLLFGGRGIPDSFTILAPLGISFYTFQSTGYLIDVYWENAEPERHFGKHLLFVSFFPQITQGPISDFGQLSPQLFAAHRFDFEQYKRGMQRMLWGFLKKMVLANMLAPWVKDVFANYPHYSGLTALIGALMYSVQIYADFSGYMDIMCGLCQTLGITLAENFERPYFSKSIAEYWRRWHITLGAWFKKYIYYPIAVARWNRTLAKRSQTRLGRHFGQTLSASIALVVVWLATGLWHGASWTYIAWGGVNGLFIILSLWMEPVYDRWKAALRIREDAWLWRAFQVLRTFLLVTFIKVLPEVGTLEQGLGLWARILTNRELPRSLWALLPFVDKAYNLAVVLLCTLLLFVCSLLQRKKPVRDRFNALPAWLRIPALAAVLIVILIFGVRASAEGGFLYAQF